MAHELSPTTISGVLDDWIASAGPLYRRLAQGFRDAIEAVRLPPGTMLPPERTLAQTLGVSRSTVVAAFEDLKRTGHLESRQGSGTWVRGRSHLPDEGNVELLDELESHAIVRNITGAPTDTIEFTAASVDCAPEVNEALLSLDAVGLARWSNGNGYSPHGEEELRELVAQRLEGLGVPTTPDQVLITGGATQAILLASRLFLEPGAPAVIETPTYGGAIDIFHAAGARLFTAELDDHGADPDELSDLFLRLRPRLTYLIADMHNPTGVVLPAERRAEIALLSDELRIPVVEDGALRELWFDKPPPPPIASFAPDAPILTIGSMSKVFWAGLRVGWVRAPQAVIAKLARLKVLADFGTPMIAQAISTQLLPLIDRTAARRRIELEERFGALQAAGLAHLPGWQLPRPSGGLSVWAKLPSPHAPALARLAPDHGVSVVPGFVFAAEHHRHADRIRIPIVAPPDVIEEGIRRLGRAWDALEQETVDDAGISDSDVA